jgi:hypothetical protein
LKARRVVFGSGSRPIIPLQFAYLLGLRRALAQVRRELHDLADRFSGYLRDV